MQTGDKRRVKWNLREVTYVVSPTRKSTSPEPVKPVGRSGYEESST